MDITACEDVGAVRLYAGGGHARPYHSFHPQGEVFAPSTGKKVVIRGIEFDRSEVLEALAESGSPDQDQKGTGSERSGS